MKRTEGKLLVEQKVEDFSTHRDEYLSKSFHEVSVRNRFIDPFFLALGWDFEQTNIKPHLWDVIREYSDQSTTKRPDYAFRINCELKFFVEAKAPHVPLTHKEPVFQAKRYAFSTNGKAPVVILTDFEEFRVFNALKKPNFNLPLEGVLKQFDLTFDQYLKKWDHIYDHFSREAVAEGALEKLKGKLTRNTKTLDQEFLTEITEWREMIARNIALRNRDLTVDELNVSVQRILDRLIFIRNLEDRQIEAEGKLLSIAESKTGIYQKLVPVFRKLDREYNGLLFKEHFCEKLSIDDKVLFYIIKHLSWPVSPYQFDVIEPEILGRIYEKFLGSKIRLTRQHHAKVEEKLEVRKAGGVYYTPQYIVDYIVKHTVGVKIRGKTPEEVDKVKIVDPACGSGSFLLSAFEYLMNYYLDYYSANQNKRRNKTDWYKTADGEIRLTMQKKASILINNIYGVDIDREATEVAVMSLYLKLLDKGFDKGQAILFMKGHILPDMSENIKCGNSLIGSGFYDGQSHLVFNDVEVKTVNAFDWEVEFPDTFATGGFDCVIGNPPWGANFNECELNYLRIAHQEIIVRMIDSYIYFINQSFKTLEGYGLFGMIVPSTILNQVDIKKLREKLLNHTSLKVLINLGEKVFGPKVLNTSTILIFSKLQLSSKIIVDDFREISVENKPNSITNAKSINRNNWLKIIKKDPSYTFFTRDLNNVKLYQRLVLKHSSFNGIIEDKIQRGISPDYFDAFIVPNTIIKQKKLETEIVKLVLLGKDIKRYCLSSPNQSVLYTKKDTRINQYPNIKSYIQEFRSKITCKEVLTKKHPWYSLHRPRNEDIFLSPKFVGLTTTKRIIVNLDEKNNYYVTDALYLFRINKYNPFCVLGIINSQLFQFLYQVSSLGEQRVIPQIKAAKLYGIPFPEKLDSNRSRYNKMIDLVKAILELNRKLSIFKTEHEKTIIQRQINATDRQIDQLVYKLYGLTGEEIKIVEQG